MKKLLFVIYTAILLCFALTILTSVSVKANDDHDLDDIEPLEAPPTEDGEFDDDDDEPEVPEGMQRENMVKWSAPNLSDEETHSSRLPGNLKCDGCTAVAYQLSTAMSAFHEHKYAKKGKKAPESEIIELTENICSKKTFENYGLKSMNGVNRLSGPGTEAVDEPGMMQGGGKWPYRVFQMCGELVGEVDEYEIYEYVVDNGADKLFSFLCENTEIEELSNCLGQKGRDEL